MKIVILTGAGISAESGISTFRDKGGLWENVRIEDVATPEAFARDPDRVWAFYNMRRKALHDPEIFPNPAHEALARLQRSDEHDVLLVTQNVDNLHERGGSPQVLHMHGELMKARCLETGQVIDWPGDMDAETVNPITGDQGTLRPHIVWFGEMPFEMDRILETLSLCDLFVSIGTSGNVYPAAGFVDHANGSGAETLEINLERSAGADYFDAGRYGPAGVQVPAWVDELLGEIG